VAGWGGAWVVRICVRNCKWSRICNRSPRVGHVRANIEKSQSVLIRICRAYMAAWCDLVLCKEHVVIRC